MFKILFSFLFLIINGNILHAQALRIAESDIRSCCEESIIHFIERGCNSELLSGVGYIDYEPMGNYLNTDNIKEVRLSYINTYIIRKKRFQRDNLLSLKINLLGSKLTISISLFNLGDFINGGKPIKKLNYFYSLHNTTWIQDSISVIPVLQDTNQLEYILDSCYIYLNKTRFNNTNNTFISSQSYLSYITKASRPFPLINLNTKYKYLPNNIRKKVKKGITILETGISIDSDTLYVYIRPIKSTYHNKVFNMRVLNETYIWIYKLSDDGKRWLLKKRVVNDFWNYSF